MTDSEIAEEVAARLEGQCVLGLDEVLEENGLSFEEAPEDLLREIDDRVFLCEGCGWWSRRDEGGVEPDHCDECSPAEED